MKTYTILIILIAIPLLLGSCSEDNVTDTLEECEIDIDTIDFTYGIDYANPDKYLIPGEESDLKDTYLEEIRNKVGTPGDSIDDILLVCHSLSLIISSVLREFDFPAVMIETANIQWGYDYNAGNVQYFKGHVMSEIFVENKWILLDNNCTYVEEYDPLNPFIFAMNSPQDDYFVYAKGIDIWDYSGRDDSFTHDNMVYFSKNIYCFEEMFNTVNYNWSN